MTTNKYSEQGLDQKWRETLTPYDTLTTQQSQLPIAATTSITASTITPTSGMSSLQTMMINGASGMMNGGMMVEMMKMKLMTDIISNFNGNNSDSGKSAIHGWMSMIIQLAVVMAFPIVISWIMNLLSKCKNTMMGYMRVSFLPIKDTTTNFKYSLVLSDSMYTSLVTAQAIKRENVKYHSELLIRDDRNYLLDLSSGGVSSVTRDGKSGDSGNSGDSGSGDSKSRKNEVRKFITFNMSGDGDILIPLKRISWCQYIYYQQLAKNKNLGSDSQKLVCNTRNEDLIDYLEELETKYGQIKKDKASLHYHFKLDNNIQHHTLTKTLVEKVHIEQKKQILEIVDRFIDGEYYKRKNLPHHLSMLFKGEPGCGKSTFIKALATYTKRSVLFFDCSTDLKTKKDLDFLVKNVDNRIIVLEDFDRVPSILIRSVDEKGSDENEIQDKQHLNRLFDAYARSQGTEEEKNKLMTLYNNELQKQKSSNDLNLTAILNVLDGIRECPGRFIIFTANHPERIVAAIRRPGRIDYEVEFRRASNEIVIDILSSFFGTDRKTIIGKCSMVTKIPSYKFTHTQIYAVCKKYDDLHKVARELCNDRLDLSSVCL